jgi:hypothetical protein
MEPVLSQRALNRATLDRQLLLRRSTMPTLEALERLVGLQAQTPHTWYTGMWSRLVDFDPVELGTALEERAVVRIALMRGTIHLVTARDCLWLRPLIQPMIERVTGSQFGRHYVELDIDAVRAAGRALVEDEPMTFSQLGKRLAERWPDRDPAALAQIVRGWEPLVQVPPRGVWGRSGQAAHTTAPHWLGAPVAADPPVEEMVRRYLAAFGPASVKDAQTWSGLTKLAEVFDKLRPDLLTFRDEDGRELFDLPDASRPDPDTPAPPRFMYDFENLFLSYDDRSRMHGPVPPTEGIFTDHGPLPGTVLVDGVTTAAWMVAKEKGAATLKIQAYGKLAAKDRSALEAEGAALLAFLLPKVAHEVQFTKLW